MTRHLLARHLLARPRLSQSRLAQGSFLLIPILLTSCNLPSQLSNLDNRDLPSNAQAQMAEPKINPPSPPPAQANPESSTAEPTASSANAPAPVPPAQATASPPRMSPLASTAKTPEAAVIPAEVDPPAQSPSGALRVGNQTEHPLRVAFLAQAHVTPEPVTPEPVTPEPDADAPGRTGRSSTSSTTSSATSSATTDPAAATDPASLAETNAALRDPFHWDFSPGEGGRDGLLLALPQGDLALTSGDVVVAFAQDGSQRYWGPYVVGQTPLPYWNGDRSEWQLLVQP